MVADSKEVIGQQGIYNTSYCEDEHEQDSKSKEIQENNNSLPVNENLGEAQKKKENIQIWRSMICNSLSLNLSYSVLLTLMNSITSLFPENNLGVLSLTTASIMQLVITAFFLTYLNKIIGLKRILLVATFLLFIYTAAFLYPTLGVFIPASLGMGITYATSIANGFGYSNALGYWYHRVNGGNLDTILSFLSGITNGCLGGGFLWGNIIYYQVLKPSEVEKSSNVTELDICGASYCNEDLGNSTIAKPPPSWKVNNLIYIFLGITVIAFLLQLFIIDVNKSTGMKKKEFFTILKKFYLLFLNPRGFLLIFISFFVGMEEQFITAVFTNAYVTCIHGPAAIGYVMFNFGAAQIIASFSVSVIVKFLGRPAVIALAFASFLCIFTILLTVPALQLSVVTLCIITFIYGATDSLIISTTCSVYGLLFPENLEGAFSLFTLWYSIGSLIANSINIYTCVYVKLYLLLAIGTAGASSYFVLEYMIYKKYFNEEK